MRIKNVSDKIHLVNVGALLLKIRPGEIREIMHAEDNLINGDNAPFIIVTDEEVVEVKQPVAKVEKPVEPAPMTNKSVQKDKQDKPTPVKSNKSNRRKKLLS